MICEKLQERSYSRLRAHLLGDLTDGTWSARPQDAQDAELGVGGLTADGFMRAIIYDSFVDVNTNFFVDSVLLDQNVVRSRAAQLRASGCR